MFRRVAAVMVACGMALGVTGVGAASAGTGFTPVQIARLVSANPADYAMFGSAVAVGGDIVAVASVGAVSIEVFQRRNDDVTPIATLTQATPGASFQSVAISGDVIVAGSVYSGIAGKAFAWVKPADGWADVTQTATLTPADGEMYDQFGSSVAVSGDTVVIGARNADDEDGAAYVFTKPESGWADATQDAKLTAADRDEALNFAASVATSGDTVVAGTGYAHEHDGAAYVFNKPEGGWVDATEDAELTPSDPGPHFLGDTVAMTEDTIVAGAYQAEAGYVFTKPDGGWVDATEDAKLTASDAEPLDAMGMSVAISGDSIALGAPGLIKYDRAAVYLYDKPDAGWTSGTESYRLTPEVADPDSRFAGQVALADGTVVVSAMSASGGGPMRGAAYVFSTKEAPTITGVAPQSGPAAGGTTLTVSGTGFDAGVSATVGGVDCAVQGTPSATSLECVTGAHAGGVVDVVVMNSDGQNATETGAFTFVAPPAPTITGVAPQSGPAAGGTTLTVTGTGFDAGVSATVGGVDCAVQGTPSATSLECVTGAHAGGVVDVVVTNSDSQSATATRAFTFVAPPGPDGTTLRVKDVPKRVSLGGRTRLVIATTDGTFTTVRARCVYRGRVLHGRNAAALCGLRTVKRTLPPVAVQTAAARHRVRISAAPTCTVGVRLEVSLRAQRSGASASAWHHAWPVAGQRTVCRLPGNG